MRMKHQLLLLSAIACFSGTLTTSAETEPVTRKWTNDNGKVIEAELGSYDGTNVTLVMKGKEFRIPIAKLSQEDRDWLAKWQEECKSRIAGLLGLRKNVTISHRYGQTTGDYFKGLRWIVCQSGQALDCGALPAASLLDFLICRAVGTSPADSAAQMPTALRHVSTIKA
jgi:hypothetical protein